MHKHSAPPTKGFVAFLSAIIISSLLLALLFVTNLSSFYARFDALDAEHEKVSLNLAESCASAALLSIAQKYTYAGNETIAIAGNTCTIDPVMYSTEDAVTHRKSATITTHASLQKVSSNFIVVASVANPTASTTPSTNILILSQKQTH